MAALEVARQASKIYQTCQPTSNLKPSSLSENWISDRDEGSLFSEPPRYHPYSLRLFLRALIIGYFICGSHPPVSYLPFLSSYKAFFGP